MEIIFLDTAFLTLQDFALREATTYGLKVSANAPTEFVLEPLRQHFWHKHQVKLLIKATLEDKCMLCLHTRGRKYFELTRLPSVFDGFLAGFASLNQLDEDYAFIPQKSLPY